MKLITFQPVHKTTFQPRNCCAIRDFLAQNSSFSRGAQSRIPFPNTSKAHTVRNHTLTLVSRCREHHFMFYWNLQHHSNFGYPRSSWGDMRLHPRCVAHRVRVWWDENLHAQPAGERLTYIIKSFHGSEKKVLACTSWLLSLPKPCNTCTEEKRVVYHKTLCMWCRQMPQIH